jgi:putative acetyltransferase
VDTGVRVTGVVVEPDDLSQADTRALVALHLADMHDGTPAGFAFVLEADALTAPGVRLFSAREGGRTLAIGALADMAPGWAEIKSMRTHPDYLRRGLAALLLDRLIAEARSAGVRRLSLETGTSEGFAPALALYRSRGFREGPAFADYPADSEYNCYLHLDLPEAPA